MTVKIAITWRRPVTILGNQEGQRFFQEGPKFIELCPILSSYVQHIFPGGAKSFVGGASPPPGYGPDVESERLYQLFHITLLVSQKQFCQVVRIRPVHSLKVLKFLSDVFATIPYSKLVLIPLQREECSKI